MGRFAISDFLLSLFGGKGRGGAGCLSINIYSQKRVLRNNLNGQLGQIVNLNAHVTTRISEAHKNLAYLGDIVLRFTVSQKLFNFNQ